MSLQVNYWLQKLGLYDSKDGFVEKSSPKTNGIKEKSTFQMICGNNYQVSEGAQTVIPILHAKCFPLNKQFKAYKPAYERIRNYFLTELSTN